MDFAAWFGTWLVRHPLKASRGVDTSRYTDEVMTKIRALEQPSQAPALVHVWLPWPRLALIAATAAVGLLIVIGTVHRTQLQLASAIDRDAQVITAVDELVPTAPNGNGATPEDLAQELQTADALILAESVPSDDQWLDQTLQLLQQLDEDVPAEAISTNGHAAESQDELLKDLQQLDEKDLTANS